MPNTWADAVEQIAARCLACHSRWEFRSGCPAPHVRQTKRASKIVLRIGAESRELARVGEELADRARFRLLWSLDGVQFLRWKVTASLLLPWPQLLLQPGITQRKHARRYGQILVNESESPSEQEFGRRATKRAYAGGNESINKR